MFSVIFAACLACATALQCIGDSGSGVDYWYIMKIPTDAGTGTGYFYADSTGGGWSLSQYGLDSVSSGAVANTLNQLYNNPTTYGYIVFNDEIPGGNTTFTLGHTKGVFAWASDASGFWMPHSAPKFPDPIPGTYSGLGYGQQLFGQNFMCISTTNPDEVGEVLETTQPYIYSENALSGYSNYEHLYNAFHNNFYTSSQGKTISVSTQGGTTVKAFAKNGPWNKDLYEDLVAPGLGQGLYVECWCHPSLSDCYSSYCTPDYQYDVMRVRNISIGNYWWVITQDHAKWALTADKETLCFGDINRKDTQKARGGGQYCIQNSAIAGQLASAIMDYDSC